MKYYDKQVKLSKEMIEMLDGISTENTYSLIAVKDSGYTYSIYGMTCLDSPRHKRYFKLFNKHLVRFSFKYYFMV